MRIYCTIKAAFQIRKIRMMNSSVTTFEMNNPIGKKFLISLIQNRTLL